jgi:hypothetical protein
MINLQIQYHIPYQDFAKVPETLISNLAIGDIIPLEDQLNIVA